MSKTEKTEISDLRRYMEQSLAEPLHAGYYI